MIKLLKGSQQGFLLSTAVGLLLTTIILVFSSCAKDPGKIGIVIQPEDSWLEVYYTDSTSLYAYSVLEDSVRSDELTRNAIGYINDPVFGATSASIFTQFILSTNGHEFGDSPQLDSLVLKLLYTGSFGDTLTELTVHTYEMLDGIDRDSVYYSNMELDLATVDYSDFTFIPQPNDSVVIDGDTLAPQVHINLTNLSADLGERLLNATEDQMEDADAFQEFFKGLYIVPSALTSEGILAYFDLTLASSKMTIYYQNASQESLQYDYLISTSTARVNKYEHDYSNASNEFKQQVIGGDTTLGQQQFYTQGYGGVRTIVNIPHPKSWRDLKNVAVNEAKLVLPAANIDAFYDQPDRLALVQKLEDGTYEFLPDQYEGDTYFGGAYEDGKYVFRITRYIQNIISDSTASNLGLYLFVNAGSVNPERFVFGGYQPAIDTADRMKLQILFTDLD